MKKVLNLLKHADSFRLKGKTVNEVLPEKVIKKLVEQQFLSREYQFPKRCWECNSFLEKKEKTNKIRLICSEHPRHHKKTIEIDEYLVYEVNVKKIVEAVVIREINNLKIKKYQFDKGFYKFKCVYEDFSVDIVFSFSSSVNEGKLFAAIGDSILLKRPVILILKKSKANIETVNTFLRKTPLGNFLFILHVSELVEVKLLNEVNTWLKNIQNLYKLERDIIDSIENKKRVSLIQSIDTNPKYALSFLSRLKHHKLRVHSQEKQWQEFEDIISVIFQSIYTSDIRYGGHQQRSKRVTDNLFFIRKNKKEKIACVVDCKFSYLTDLSREKTEKYLGYLEDVRTHPYVQGKLALIFVVLETKSLGTIKNFFQRIEKFLEKREYCVILPVNFLEILLHIYTGAIIRGKVNLSPKDFNTLLEDIFSKGYLKDKENYMIYPRLYKLDPESIQEEIKKRCKDTSSIEKAFSEIFEKG